MYSDNAIRLFHGTSTDDAISRRDSEMVDEINRLDLKTLTTKNVDEITLNFERKYSFRIPQLRLDEKVHKVEEKDSNDTSINQWCEFKNPAVELDSPISE